MTYDAYAAVSISIMSNNNKILVYYVFNLDKINKHQYLPKNNFIVK